jgi:Bifunctional DNA primase/polymerase, N-terminal/Primase C terminal 1 (PriCT-1)
MPNHKGDASRQALRDAALAFAAKGRAVFPVKVDKTPHTQHGFKDASNDEGQIRRWWDRWPDAWIGTPTGDGLFVLDVDDEQALASLEQDHEPLPPTVEAVTPRPGRHIYLRGNVSNSAGLLASGLDVRGAGGFVILPPSPHPNGAYEWRTAPDELPFAPAPSWLLALLDTSKRTNGSAPPVEGVIPCGERDDTLTSLAGTMRRRSVSEAGIAACLLVENRDRCKPPLDESEVLKLAHSVARYRPAVDLGVTFSALTALLGLDKVDRRVDKVDTHGHAYRPRRCCFPGIVARARLRT